MTLTLPNEADLRIERGGPTDRILRRIGLIREDGPSVARRIVFSVAVTWVPLLILSLLQDRALGPTPRESFLLDFASYARFLVFIPLLIAAESFVGPPLTNAARTFLRTDLVRPKDLERFQSAANRVARLRESRWAEIVILAVAIFGSWNLTLEDMYGVKVLTWRTLQNGSTSWAGLWYHGVAIPLLQFLLLRWLWRLAIWTRFLWDMARLDLDLVPTHADGAGGLGFLGTAHGFLGIFALAAGSVLAANTAFQIVYEGATLKGSETLLLAFLTLCVLFFLGPLAFFAPSLERARRDGLRSYGLLIDQYNRAFHDKWAEGRRPSGEPLLGTSDIQSLADLGTSYDRVKQMKVFPAARRTLLRIVMMGAAPALLPVLLVVPLVEILKKLATAVM
jgi:hypothetical protein